MSLAKHWCFTLNNYTQQDEDKILSAFNAGGINYLVFGKEVSSTGTPHLQGFVSFKTRKRLTGCISTLGQAHYSVAKSIGKAIEYCRKEGVVTEYGTPPSLQPSTQGKRTDLESFKDAVKGGMVDAKELREAFSDVMAKYPRFALSYVRDHKPLPEVEAFTLYDWQSRLVERVSERPDSRTVIFVVDEAGNTGKTAVCNYLERNKDGVQIMKCGKRDDMAFELDENVKILIIDVSRSAGSFLNYQFIEDVKDGRVFSPKYESFTKRFNSPHVVVMMNEEPDRTKLSLDRYEVVYPTVTEGGRNI